MAQNVATGAYPYLKGALGVAACVWHNYLLHFLHMMSWQRGCAVKGALEQGIKAARVLVVGDFPLEGPYLITGLPGMGCECGAGNGPDEREHSHSAPDTAVHQLGWHPLTGLMCVMLANAVPQP